ncbi:MAG: hypothetical protein IPM79_20555 [Polyangiaceae bacterium]|nr:hypothetical protein [Polyangiaceae bacterium]MBK8939946.1 hypothetical protein [Polyangiaceae bacterium]
MKAARAALRPSLALVSGVGLWLVLALGCDAEKRAKQLVDGASSGASDLKDGVTTAAKDKVNGMTSAARFEVVAAKAKVFGLTDTGAISEAGLEWLSSQKPADGSTGVEGVVAKGIQIAPVVIEAHRVMNQAVDEDTAIEPIYQPIEAGKEPELDASIKAMPRMDVVDGVTVGFKKLDSIENTKIKKEQAVLVLWRRDTHLVGFLYRSHRTVDLEVVVTETPRLYKLMNAAAG